MITLDHQGNAKAIGQEMGQGYNSVSNGPVSKKIYVAISPNIKRGFRLLPSAMIWQSVDNEDISFVNFKSDHVHVEEPGKTLLESAVAIENSLQILKSLYYHGFETMEVRHMYDRIEMNGLGKFIAGSS